MTRLTDTDDRRSSAFGPEERELLRRGIRLNTLLLGLVMGAGLGLCVFLVTHASLLITGDNAGRYLNLLGVFFPGYSASPAGAWIGFFWGSIAGFVSGAIVYQIYGRSIAKTLADTIVLYVPDESPVRQPILRISGHALGVALGGLMAVQLFAGTSWLIVRGTADQSIHAALLAQYFPGYSVTILGALVGAAYIFVTTYLASRLLAGIYNLIVDKKPGVEKEAELGE